MLCKTFLAGDDKFASRASTNDAMDYSMQSFMNIYNPQFPNNSMSIPINLLLFPLDTVSSPKYPAIASIILVFTCLSMCNTLLS